ncbi:hypothetical protein ACRN9T_19060 [Shewanella baltica]|uniref:hypothetical protein n=1 Tax=Shewanella baltica TaxID=62322 RepID=UPI003D7BEB51
MKNPKLHLLVIFLGLPNSFTFAKVYDCAIPAVSLHDSLNANIQLVAQVSEAMSDEEAKVAAEVEAYTTDFNEFKKFDKRKVKITSSPSYLDAVGRLTIKTKKGEKFQCSAYLTSGTPGASSNKLGSAAHCINEYANIKDKLKTPKKIDIASMTWTTTVNGQTITKNVKILEFDFETDQMLLEIDSKIPFNKIKPLLLETEMEFSPKELILTQYPTQLISAGFNADSYKGEGGKVLTYDDSIDVQRVTVQDLTKGDSIVPITVTYSGGSGGPLIAKMDLTEEDVSNPYDQMYVIGTLYGFSGIDQSMNYEDKNRALGTNRPGIRDYTLLIRLYEKHK